MVVCLSGFDLSHSFGVGELRVLDLLVVVDHQGEIDVAVGHVARDVAARIAGVGLAKAEDVLIEPGCLLQVGGPRSQCERCAAWPSPRRELECCRSRVDTTIVGILATHWNGLPKRRSRPAGTLTDASEPRSLSGTVTGRSPHGAQRNA